MNSSSSKISSQEINAAFREYQQELKNTVHHRFSGIIEKYSHLANDLPPVENSPHLRNIKKSEKRKRELYSLLCKNISISEDDLEPLCSEPQYPVLNNFPHVEFEKDFETDSCCILPVPIKDVDEKDCVPVYQIDSPKFLRSLKLKSDVEDISRGKFLSLKKKRKHKRLSRFPLQLYAGGISEHKTEMTLNTSCWNGRLRRRENKSQNFSMNEESQSTQICKKKRTFQTKCSDQSIKKNFVRNPEISHDKPSKYFALMEDLSIHIISNIDQVNPKVIYFMPLYVTKENKYSFRNPNGNVSPRNHITAGKSEKQNEILKEPFSLVSYPFGQAVEQNRGKNLASQASGSNLKNCKETKESLNLPNLSIKNCGKMDELGKHKGVKKNDLPCAQEKLVMPPSRTIISSSRKPSEGNKNGIISENALKRLSSRSIHQSSPTFKRKCPSHSEKECKVTNDQLIDKSHSLKESLRKEEFQTTSTDLTFEKFSLINKNQSLKESLEKARSRNICTDLTNKNFSLIKKSHTLKESSGKENCKTTSGGLTKEKVSVINKSNFHRESLGKNCQTTSGDLTNKNISFIDGEHSLKESSLSLNDVLESTRNSTGPFKFPMSISETGNSVLNKRKKILKNYITLSSQKNTSENCLLFDNTLRKFSPVMKNSVSGENDFASKEDASNSVYANHNKQDALKTPHKNLSTIESKETKESLDLPNLSIKNCGKMDELCKHKSVKENDLPCAQEKSVMPPSRTRTLKNCGKMDELGRHKSVKENDLPCAQEKSFMPPSRRPSKPSEGKKNGKISENGLRSSLSRSIHQSSPTFKRKSPFHSERNLKVVIYDELIDRSHSLKESLRKEKYQTTNDNLSNEKVNFINKNHSFKEYSKEKCKNIEGNLTNEKYSFIDRKHSPKESSLSLNDVLKTSRNRMSPFKLPVSITNTGNSILNELPSNSKENFNTQSHVSNISNLTLRETNPLYGTNRRKNILKNYITLKSKENTSEKCLLFDNPFRKFSSSMNNSASDKKDFASKKNAFYSIYANRSKQDALKTLKKNSSTIKSNKIISTISKGLNKKLSIISEESEPKYLKKFLPKENSSRSSSTKSKPKLILSGTYHSLFEDKDAEVPPAGLNLSFPSFRSLMTTSKNKSASDDSKLPENLENDVASISILPSFSYENGGNEDLSRVRESKLTSSFHKDNIIKTKLDISQIAGPPNNSLSYRPLKVLRNDTSACPFAIKFKETVVEKKQKLENVASYLMSQATEIGDNNQASEDVTSLVRHKASESTFASSTFSRFPNLSISTMKSSLNESDYPRANLSKFLSR